ncbi:MAG: roadblock/LC7 domain-containing protein [Candidatus Thorarchaeota archaeon]
MKSELNEALQCIREIAGVENVVLVQRDGVPVASAGVWFSKEEVFAVASSTCAIYGVARVVHGNFKYLLMESTNSKVFIASLPGNINYFLTVTTAPRVNLAALFIEMKQNLSRITFLLKQHLENNLPPLRTYSSNETENILQGFSVIEGHRIQNEVSFPVISIDRSRALALREILRQITDTIPDTISAFFTLNGGIRVSLTGFSDDRLAAMTFALYDASERVIRTLRNTNLERVTCEGTHGRHFIYAVPNGVFSLWVSHNAQKLGLVRLLLKHYITEANRILETVTSQSEIPQELKELLLLGSMETSGIFTRGES